MVVLVLTHPTSLPLLVAALVSSNVSQMVPYLSTNIIQPIHRHNPANQYILSFLSVIGWEFNMWPNSKTFITTWGGEYQVFSLGLLVIRMMQDWAHQDKTAVRSYMQRCILRKKANKEENGNRPSPLWSGNRLDKVLNFSEIHMPKTSLFCHGPVSGIWKQTC